MLQAHSGTENPGRVPKAGRTQKNTDRSAHRTSLIPHPPVLTTARCTNIPVIIGGTYHKGSQAQSTDILPKRILIYFNKYEAAGLQFLSQIRPMKRVEELEI
jgi:hypothetical protein